MEQRDKKLVVLTAESPWMEMVPEDYDPAVLTSNTCFKINGKPHRLVAVKIDAEDLITQESVFEGEMPQYIQVGVSPETNRVIDLLDSMDASSEDPFVMTEIDGAEYIVYAVPLRLPLERSVGGEANASETR